ALLETGAAPEAEAVLLEWLGKGQAAPVAERRELAKLLGRLGEDRWAPALGEAMKDGDPSVRALAIQAVGEGRCVSLASTLLPFLTWRDERRTARDALSALGDEIVPLLEEVLNDRSRPAALRYQLPRVLRQIGTQQAFDALLFSNVQDDAFLHYRIGVALSWLKEERPELEVDARRAREAIGRRRDTYRQLVGPWRDLRVALGDGSLLTRAVGDRLDQAFEISFWLMGLLYPPKTMRRIHAHLVGTDARRRAYALELLENLVDDEDRELVALQVHAHHRDLPPGAAGRLADQLEKLCQSDDHVLRACAQHLARAQGVWPLAPSENDMSDATLKRMFALEGVEIFAQSDVDDISAVAAVAREVRFRAGERIYEEGDPGDALYVIVTGTVDAYRRGDRVLTLKDREQFGDVSLLDGSPRPTLMIAREDTSCLVIDRRDFLDLIADRPELLKGIFRAVSRQLSEVVDLAARRNTGELAVALTSRIG
ncbi:MAG: cyclic nucleotide-binding domain-containing protein, partial [Myxococcaceae bacterium]